LVYGTELARSKIQPQFSAVAEPERYPGRSEEQKKKLADEIVKDVVAIAKCDEKSVSVAFEEIEKEDWADKVYKPDILDRKDSLYKEPGYNPFE
jgi:4-oxalocrotonate tautomerase